LLNLRKKGRFCRTQHQIDVSEDKYLSVLDYWLVKMRLKGDENRRKVGFYNAPKYSYKAGKNGNFKTIIRNM